MKLIPRQRTHTPPRLEMKSSHVILCDRSNSENEECEKLCEYLRSKTKAEALKKWCFNTKYSWTSKEDVQYSYILLIGIVVSVLLEQSEGVFKFRDADLGKRDQQLSLCIRLPMAWISRSHRSRQCPCVGGRTVPIGGVDVRLPLGQGLGT